MLGELLVAEHHVIHIAGRLPRYWWQSLIGGRAPADLFISGRAPVDPLIGGRAPVDLLIGGRAPVDPLIGGRAPADPLGQKVGAGRCTWLLAMTASRVPVHPLIFLYELWEQADVDGNAAARPRCRC